MVCHAPPDRRLPIALPLRPAIEFCAWAVPDCDYRGHIQHVVETGKWMLGTRRNVTGTGPGRLGRLGVRARHVNARGMFLTTARVAGASFVRVAEPLP